jgi:hypothetical protein
MIPVSNKTRSVTRVRYTHATFWRQEKWERDFSAAVACAVLGGIRLTGFNNSADDSGRYNSQRETPLRNQNEIDCGIISPGDD